MKVRLGICRMHGSSRFLIWLVLAGAAWGGLGSAASGQTSPAYDRLRKKASSFSSEEIEFRRNQWLEALARKDEMELWEFELRRRKWLEVEPVYLRLLKEEREQWEALERKAAVEVDERIEDGEWSEPEGLPGLSEKGPLRRMTLAYTPVVLAFPFAQDHHLVDMTAMLGHGVRFGCRVSEFLSFDFGLSFGYALGIINVFDWSMGYFAQLSLGPRLEVGGSVKLILRPSISYEIVEFHREYESTYGRVDRDWRVNDRSLGLCLDAGVEFVIRPRFRIRISLSLNAPFDRHEGRRVDTDLTNPGSPVYEYKTYYSSLSAAGALELVFNF